MENENKEPRTIKNTKRKVNKMVVEGLGEISGPIEISYIAYNANSLWVKVKDPDGIKSKEYNINYIIYIEYCDE